MNQIGRVKYVGFANTNDLVPELEELVETWMQASDHKMSDDQLENEYCPIKTTLLMRATPLKGDLFVRLSERKYVRIMASGAEFEREDLQKYHEKKRLEYMYVRREDAAYFMQAFTNELKELLAKPTVTLTEAEQVVESSHEAVTEMIARVGFSEEVREIAKASIELAVKAIGENPQLGKIFAQIKANRDKYTSGHSITLANVACCIAAAMDWVTKATYEKLAMAAFFHDILLKNDDLARIDSLDELQQKQADLKDEEIKAYRDHAINAANLVKQFKEIPADVDMIIIHHHERPGGQGFPRGLSDSQVGPLSCLFIIAHDLVDAMYVKGDDFNTKDWLNTAKGKFHKGNYRKVVNSLLEIDL